MSLHKRYRHTHTHIDTHSGSRTESWKECCENQQGKQRCLCICLASRCSLCYIMLTNQTDSDQTQTKNKKDQPNLKISSHSDTTYLLLLLFFSMWPTLSSSALTTSTSSAFWHSDHTAHPVMTPRHTLSDTHGVEGGSPTLWALPETPLPGVSGKRELMLPLSLSLSQWRGCRAVALDRLSLNI